MSWLRRKAYESTLDLEAGPSSPYHKQNLSLEIAGPDHTGLKPPAEPEFTIQAEELELDVWKWPPQLGLLTFLQKLKGQQTQADALPSLQTIVLATLGSFLVIKLLPCDLRDVTKACLI